MSESMYDHLPPAHAALAAWANHGACDQYHLTMQNRVRRDMPLLARALDRAHTLIRENGDRLQEPLAITDDMVERAAIQMCASGQNENIWKYMLYEEERESFRKDARSALAAALGGGDDA